MLTAKQQYWSEQLEKARLSGQSLSQYAKEQNIPIKKLYQWRSTLKRITTTKTTHEEVHFTEVSVPSLRVPLLRLRCGDALLEFTSLPDPQWIRHLIEAER